MYKTSKKQMARFDKYVEWNKTSQSNGNNFCLLNMYMVVHCFSEKTSPFQDMSDISNWSSIRLIFFIIFSLLIVYKIR